MTKDEALRMALEALEAHADIGIKSDKAITAVKEALANVATIDTSKECVDETAIQRHEQEPVAKNEEGRITWLVDNWPQNCFLYTTPPQRKPLTDEQIQTVHDNVPDDYTEDSWVHSFARAIEVAHGIKENT